MKLTRKRTLFSCGVALFVAACASTQTHTISDVVRTEKPDGTVITETHTETTTTTTPVGGKVTVDVAGVTGSAGITMEKANGETTTTEVDEGEETDVPDDTESVTTETETTEPPDDETPSGTSQATSSFSVGSASPVQFRMTYCAYPELVEDVLASVSVKARGTVIRRSQVKSYSNALGAYFRAEGMGLLQDGTPTGSALPSFLGANVIVDEVLYVEETDAGANFHYYDIKPFERVEFSINGTSYDLNSPGVVKIANAVKGWYHVIIPVPGSQLAPVVNYASTIKKEGSRRLGGRSMQLFLQ